MSLAFPINQPRCCTQALTQDDRSVSSSRNKETPPTSARLQHQETGQVGQGVQESMPSVPALALGVVAPAPAAAAASDRSGRSGRSSSSRLPSSWRSGDNSNRSKSDRNEPITKKNTSNDTNKTAVVTADRKSRAGEGADVGREQRPGVPVGAEDDNSGGAVTGPGTGGHGRGGGGSEGQAGTGGTVPVPVKRRVSVQVVAAKIVDKVCTLSSRVWSMRVPSGMVLSGEF